MTVRQASHLAIGDLFGSCLATQTVIIGQLYSVEGRCRFIDLDAWLLIAIVTGAVALVYYTPGEKSPFESMA